MPRRKRRAAWQGFGKAVDELDARGLLGVEQLPHEVLLGVETGVWSGCVGRIAGRGLDARVRFTWS